jgi:hypothetical protein
MTCLAHPRQEDSATKLYGPGSTNADELSGAQSGLGAHSVAPERPIS